MRSWKQHIVSKEQQSGQKHYLDRRRFNRWNIMSGGEALTPAQCKQLETSVRDSGGIIVERMTAGSRGCVFKLRADDGTFYIKNKDAEDCRRSIPYVTCFENETYSLTTFTLLFSQRARPFMMACTLWIWPSETK